MKKLLFLLCMFPYVGFGILTTDTQPWSLVMSVIIIGSLALRGKLQVPAPFKFFFFTFVIALLYFFYGVATTSGDTNYGLTSLTYYLSTPMIALAVYNVGVPEKIHKWFLAIFFIWFAFALIQIVAPSVNAILVNTVRSSSERGLTSLAPEPVWYARSVLLFMLVALYLYKNNLLSVKYYRIVVLLSIFQIIALSLSGTIFFYLCLILLLYSLIMLEKIRYKISILAVLVVLGGGLIIVGINNYSDKRVFNLINIAIENPENLSKYGGFSMRVLNAPMAVKMGIFESNGIGTGLIPEKGGSQKFTFLGQIVDKEDSGRLNGGYVLFIYQIGIFAFIWLTGFVRAVNYNKNIPKRLRLFILLSLFAILFFESSLSNPISAYLLGLIMVRNIQFTKPKPVQPQTEQFLPVNPSA